MSEAKFFEVANGIVSTPSTPGIADYQQQRTLIMAALADARRQAFIEAAGIAEDHMPAIQCMSVEPIVSACLDIANDIRAKAEKTQG